jgi:hypothetical protein
MADRTIVLACGHDGCSCSTWLWLGQPKPERCPWCKQPEAWRVMRIGEWTAQDRKRLRELRIAPD